MGVYTAAVLVAFTIIHLTTPITSLQDTACPPKCSCTNHNKDVVCSSRKDFPKIAPGVQRVTVRDSIIQEVKAANKLPTSVESLTIQNCQTEQVDDGFFPSGSRMKILSLRDNRFHEVPVGFFKDVPKLEQLDLSGNKLTDLRNVSKSLHRLTSLDLSRNAISSEEVSFALCRLDVSHLRSVFLEEMGLTSVPQGLMSCSRKTRDFPLTLLSLSKNRLTTVPPQMNATNIRKLFLASNKIRVIGKQSFPKSLQHLVLANNPLNMPSLSSVSNLTNLTHLDFGGINLLIFPTDLFESLHKLEYLSLENCNIGHPLQVTVLVGSLKKLKILGLQSNQLKQIPKTALAHLGNLEALYLDNNRITEIREDKRMELVLFHLKKLGVSNNPYRCDCQIVWFSKWLRYKSRYTEIVNLNNTVCDSPQRYKRERLLDFRLGGCDWADTSAKLVVFILAAIIALVLVFAILVVCCRSTRVGSRMKTKLLPSKQSLGYQSV